MPRQPSTATMHAHLRWYSRWARSSSANTSDKPCSWCECLTLSAATTTSGASSDARADASAAAGPVRMPSNHSCTNLAATSSSCGLLKLAAVLLLGATGGDPDASPLRSAAAAAAATVQDAGSGSVVLHMLTSCLMMGVLVGAAARDCWHRASGARGAWSRAVAATAAA
jgi:hypothetical protein